MGKAVFHVQVYAVDVGYGQLALELRKDPRVVVMERTNARHINQTSVSTQPNLVVCDASFIPLHKVRLLCVSVLNLRQLDETRRM